MDAHLQVLDAYIIPGTNVQVAPVDSVKDAGAVFSQSSWAVKLGVTPLLIHVDSMLQLEGVQRHSGAVHHTSVRTSIPYALPYVLPYVFPNVLYPTHSPTYSPTNSPPYYTLRATLRTPLRTIVYVLPYVLFYVLFYVPSYVLSYVLSYVPSYVLSYARCSRVGVWHCTPYLAQRTRGSWRLAYPHRRTNPCRAVTL